jgi:hypothetical protein
MCLKSSPLTQAVATNNNIASLSSSIMTLFTRSSSVTLAVQGHVLLIVFSYLSTLSVVSHVGLPSLFPCVLSCYRPLTSLPGGALI